MKLIQELTALTEATKKQLPTTGSGTPEFKALMLAFMEYAISQDMHDTAIEDGQEVGTKYLVDKMVDWLTFQNYTYKEVDKFFDAHGDDVNDYISSTID